MSEFLINGNKLSPHEIDDLMLILLKLILIQKYFVFDDGYVIQKEGFPHDFSF